MSQGLLIINSVKYRLPEGIEAKENDCVVTDEDGIFHLTKVNGIHALASRIEHDTLPKNFRTYCVHAVK